MWHDNCNIYFMKTLIYEHHNTPHHSELQSGHAQRLAGYARRTALAINTVDSGPLEPLRFSEQNIVELTYAALLHDVVNLATEQERAATLRLLSKLPWPDQYRSIPAILALLYKKLYSPRGVYEPDSDPVTMMGHILAIAHIFDHITTSDDYARNAADFDTTALVLHLEAGKKALDQDIVDLFLSIHA